MIRNGVKRPSLEDWSKILDLLDSQDEEVRLLGVSLLNTFSVSNHIIKLCYEIAYTHLDHIRYLRLMEYIHNTINK